MSRSNPTQNNPNPATRRFEWKGGEGKLQWYDKGTKENVAVALPFTFMLLDELATVRGYSKRRKTGMYANEVRDTRREPFVVKFQDNGEVLAEGLWTQIKERVALNKGQFAINAYCGFKNGEKMQIGVIKIAGCALGPWFDFIKKHRKDAYEKAVTIHQGEVDSTGDVEFIPPVFAITELSEPSKLAAVALDKELQAYLDGYLKQPVSRTQEQESPAQQSQPDAQYDPEPDSAPMPQDDVPF